MFSRLLLAFALLIGFSTAAYAQEINTDVGCDSSGAWMLGTGWTVSGSKCVASNARAMSMLMQMNMQVRKGRRYRVTFDLSGYTGTGFVRATVGVDKPVTIPPGSWVLASSLTPIADRFTTSDVVVGGTTDFRTTCLWYGPSGTSGSPIPCTNGHTDGLQGPGDSAEDIGSFRVFCTHGKFGWIDPVLAPGKIGGHIHEFVGNAGVQPDWTYSDFRNKGTSTCQNGNPDKPLNPSGYWWPSLLEDLGTQGLFVVKSNQTLIYYKGPAKSGLDHVGGATSAGNWWYDCDESWGGGDGGSGTGLRSDGGTADLTHDPNTGAVVTNDTRCPQLPHGLKYIFGFNMSDPTHTATNYSGQNPNVASGFAYGAIEYSCYPGSNGEGGTVGGPSLPTTGPGYHSFPELVTAINANPTLCPIGAQIHVSLGGYDCWDGVHIDSPNHRDHMAYGWYSTTHLGNQRCPVDHPYPVPKMSVQNYYTVDQALLDGKWRWSVDEMVDGLTAGTGSHMDYVFAWSPTLSDHWFQFCNHAHNSCTSEFGDGTRFPLSRNFDDPAGTGSFCNGCAKARPDRYVPSTEYGMSRDYAANGSYSVDMTAPGDGVFAFAGFNGFNGSLDNIHVVEIPSNRRNR